MILSQQELTLFTWAPTPSHRAPRNNTLLLARPLKLSIVLLLKVRSAEVVSFLNVLHELGISGVTSPVIYCDNIGATHLIANPIFKSPMKHLGVD